MFVVISGDPFDGMTLFGPFEDGEDANSYADTELAKETWWVMQLKPPGRKFWSPREGGAGPLYVAASGDAFRGLTLHGPFHDAAGAKEWGAAHGSVTIELLQEP